MSAGWADGIVANTLFVRDLAAAKEFYRTAFDSEPIFEDPNSVVFRLGGTVVNLLHESAVPELIGPAVGAADGQLPGSGRLRLGDRRGSQG
jgi:catechol 2,3-dioxygenase-like lactoylglutathione lyase family enzyme